MNALEMPEDPFMSPSVRREKLAKIYGILVDTLCQEPLNGSYLMYDGFPVTTKLSPMPEHSIEIAPADLHGKIPALRKSTRIFRQTVGKLGITHRLQLAYIPPHFGAADLLDRSSYTLHSARMAFRDHKEMGEAVNESEKSWAIFPPAYTGENWEGRFLPTPYEKAGPMPEEHIIAFEALALKLSTK